MAWETFTKVVDRIREVTRGERYAVSFSGMGEPMLNPKIYDFVRYVAGEAETGFSSNGSVLTDANVSKLIESGLNTVYVSFNADESELFAKMTGGLVYDKILANVKNAVARTSGTGTKVLANVSMTKANQHRVAGTRALLEGMGISPVTVSLVHNRGGFLKDPEVCDTPIPVFEHWSCDVFKHTLFIDWEGKVLICVHDLDGDHAIGDLMTEPLDVILNRRDDLLAAGVAPKICQGCNDIGRIGGTFPLESQAGGIFRDWMFYLHEEHPEPLGEANDAMRWAFDIFKNRGRLDLLVNRLLKIEREANERLAAEQEERRRVVDTKEDLAAQIRDLERDRDALAADQKVRARDRETLVSTIKSMQESLDKVNRDYALLHTEYAAVRRNALWRLGDKVSRMSRRILGRA
jgi:hypothetical protein